MRGDPVIEERTYSFEEDTFVPFAHHDARTVAGQREDLGTVHYATDPIGTPTHLVGPDGAVLGRVERTAWGARMASDAASFDPHPALPIPAELPPGSSTPPGTRGKCAEVNALSQLLDREGVPRDGTATKEQVDAAMSKIDKVETVAPRKKGDKPKKACDYCNKMMADLGIPPEKIIHG